MRYSPYQLLIAGFLPTDILYEVILKEEELQEDPAKSEAQNIMRYGRHQILPSFWNLLVWHPRN